MSALHMSTDGTTAYCGTRWRFADLSLDWSPVTCVQCRALLAIREVEQDMADDVVPSDVTKFGMLHDYVDANEYGGLCDTSLMFAGDDDETPEEFWDMANAVQDEVHRWLAGRADG